MKLGFRFWFAFYMKYKDAWSHKVHTPEAMEAIDARYDLDDPVQKQEYDTQYMCDWNAGHTVGQPYVGAVTAAEEEGRVYPFTIDRMHPVGTAWDDGRGVTAVWFYQLVNYQPRVIHFFKIEKGSLEEAARECLKFYAKHNLHHGVHVLPHTMAEHDYIYQEKISREAALRRFFRNQGEYAMVPKVDSIDTKLLAGQQFIPQCLFRDCADIRPGLESLMLYARKETSSGSNKYTKQIADNGHDHAGDAFGELALAFNSGEVQAKLNNLLIKTNYFYGPQQNLLHPY